MTAEERAAFHQLFHRSKPRVVYYKKDFLDYVVMICITALVICFSYGAGHIMSLVGLGLCGLMVITFASRHGVELRIPLIVRKPQEIVYTLSYKLQNLKAVYFVALGMLLLENVLIAATPNLPHHVELMRRIFLWLFFIHFLSISAYRTLILVAHLLKRELVREVLMQTPWRRVVNQKTNITLEIVHAYCTGLLTHIVTMAPWYIVIVASRFSVIFLPITLIASVFLHLRWSKVFNAWFYRDHWLGHNSEFDFVFLHGPHHDAIPSGMIAVAENGFLEGALRFIVGAPISLYNPLISFLIFSTEVPIDIIGHQYIPGVFPRLPRKVLEEFQHSTHHYGPLEPYSIASRIDRTNVSPGARGALFWIPEEVKASIELDEELTGFNWDNPTYRRTLSLWDKYQPDELNASRAISDRRA
jgi:hypothetical protein